MHYILREYDTHVLQRVAACCSVLHYDQEMMRMCCSVVQRVA